MQTLIKRLGTGAFRLLLFSCTVGSSTGCQISVSGDDIVGRWVVSSDSSQRIRSHEFTKSLNLSDTAIEFEGDGSFRGRNLPMMMISLARENLNGVFDGGGTWRIADEEGPIVSLSFNFGSARPQARTSLRIYRTRGDFYLSDSTDPDSGPEIIYRRAK